MSGSIDHKGPSYTTLMKGNPNGPSHFIDLHGFRPGSISTNLSGLAAGNTYILTLWYAKNDYASSANCNIQIGDGTWLNESWNSTNSGSDIWLQKCFTFTAKGTSAELKLIGSGPFGTGGMLLDDIKLWKCPKPKA